MASSSSIAAPQVWQRHFTTETEKDLAATGPMETFRVVLDTSFLFIPFQFNMDIMKELGKTLNRRFEPVVLSTTIEELQKLTSNRCSKPSRQAALALSLAQKCRIVDAEKTRGESYDDVIARTSYKMKCCVATNDKALRKRLRQAHVPVVYMRKKAHLIVEGLT